MKSPVTTRSDVPWDPDYTYDCSAGHELAADVPLERCPLVVRGTPCTGELRRFGKGSRPRNGATP